MVYHQTVVHHEMKQQYNGCLQAKGIAGMPLVPIKDAQSFA